MPKKLNPDKTYGQKLIKLFTLLLFSAKSYSLTELAMKLDCSKPTILRLANDISNSYTVPIEEELRGNRKYFRIAREKVERVPAPISELELTVLEMCRTFAEGLLGREHVEIGANALLKSRDYLQDCKINASGHHFASFRSGSIDYTPHQDKIRLIIEAMEKRRICRIAYRRIMTKRNKILYVKPVKIFSYKDTVYLHAQMSIEPGKKYREPDFDPTLAIHRIESVELTHGIFDYSKNYDFEKIFKRDFGIIKGESFQVEVEFSGWAAQHVTERIWSQDQRLHKKKGGKVLLAFHASSEPEVISWILSFGAEARVVSPERLANNLKKTVSEILMNYKTLD